MENAIWNRRGGLLGDVRGLQNDVFAEETTFYIREMCLGLYFAAMWEWLKKCLSMRLRLVILFLAVVVLPIIVLLIVQFRALVELREKSRLALRENLRGALHRVEEQTEARLREASRELLMPTSLEELRSWNLEKIRGRFRAMQQAHPEIDQLFAYSGCMPGQIDEVMITATCSPGQKERLFYLDANRERAFESANFSTDTTYLEAPEYETLLLFFVGALNLRSSADRKEDIFFWQGACSGCSPDRADNSRFFAFHLASGRQPAEKICVTGVSLKTEFLRKKIFPAVIAEGDGESPLLLGVFDEGQQPVYANFSGAQPLELKVPFNPLFPRWTLAGGYRDQPVEALAGAYFRRSLLLSALVILLLVGGLLLTARVIAREVELAEAKSTFVSNVSHELKTPLSLIRLFAETLELGRVKSPEKAREYHRIIVNESRRLTAMIDNILDFARIEAGRREYSLAETDLAEVAASVVRSYEYVIRKEGFELTTDLDNSLPLVRVDRDAIGQALLNLLNNAIKYSPEVKRIELRVGRQNGCISISVRDQGMGIAKAEQARIFEKFYRSGQPLVHDTKGAGLGLSLVKHIVEAHGGQVTVESAPGRGSCFTLLLPIAA